MSYDVIISNSKLNSYGYRVLTSGINYSQYQRNPILLWMHNRPFSDRTDTMLPLGRVDNLRIEADSLVGTLVFDEADNFSKQIKAKWDAGTLRMVSAGLEILETSNGREHLLEGQTLPTITKSKLLEVSVVDIGANDDALALYHQGALVNLALDGGDNSFLKPIKNHLNNIKMEEVNLKLGLSKEATVKEVLTAIEALQLQAGKVEELQLQAGKVEELQKIVAEEKEKAIVALVDAAVENKRITADKKAHFVSLGEKVGYEALQETLNLMSPAVKPMDIIHRTGGENEVKKFSELSAEEAIRLRSENRDTYVRLFKAEYGVEPDMQD